MNIEEKIRQTSHGNAGQRERTIALVKKIVFDGRRIDAERSEAATGLTAERLTGILRSCKVLDPFTDELVDDIDTPESAIALDSLTTDDPAPDAPAKPDSEPSEPPSKEPRRRPGRPKGSTVPKPKVLTRPPNNQNEHMFAVLNHRDLNAFEQHIGFVAHIKIGSELHGQFGDPGKGVELAAANIAREAKRPNSQSKVGTAMKRLVEVGLFRRLDNGQGNSKARGNKATYVPVVPDLS